MDFDQITLKSRSSLDVCQSMRLQQWNVHTRSSHSWNTTALPHDSTNEGPTVCATSRATQALLRMLNDLEGSKSVALRRATVFHE